MAMEFLPDTVGKLREKMIKRGKEAQQKRGTKNVT